MKKLVVKSFVAGFIMVLAVLCGFCIKTKAFEFVQGDPFEQPVKMRCTVYLDEGTTASGSQTRNGIIAGRREWLGKVAALYEIDENGNIVPATTAEEE